MTSGVYTLTFSSGATYIGKSIDIENRWKQHAEKFIKGTAAKAMQAEYDSYGFPEGTIAFECHEDHIDTVEACFINRLKPPLNGTYPKDPFIGIQDEEFDNLLALLNMSTVQHVAKIYEFKAGQDENNVEIALLKSSLLDMEDLVEELDKQRNQETIDKDISRTIKDQKITISTQMDNLVHLRKHIEELVNMLNYERKPWWQKLFS